MKELGLVVAMGCCDDDVVIPRRLISVAKTVELL